MNKLAKFTFGALALASAVPAFATDEFQYAITLPDGCNVGSWITAAIQILGGIAAVALTGYMTFKAIKVGLRWVGLIRG